MYKKSRYHLLLILLILISGCEKNVKDGLFPEFEQKLVIMAFITPEDTASYVSIMPNYSIFGEKQHFEDPGNLKGYISDGNREISLKNNAYYLYFNKNDMNVEAGKTYTLRIISDKGFEVKGSTTVPDKFDSGLKIDTMSIVNTEFGYTWKEAMFNAEFGDQPGKENFYRIIAYQITYLKYSGSNPGGMIRQFNLGKDMFREADLNTEGKFSISSALTSNFAKSDSSFLKIYLLNCDKSYYLYHKSLNNYSDNENPFTEASPVYSNISGGLGIFTSYTVDSLIFRLK